MQSILPVNGSRTIDLDAVRAVTAVPNETPFEAMSERYRLFNTFKLVERATELGLAPTAAFYQKARKPNRGGDSVRRHCIRMARTDDIASGEDTPEVVIVNSHNGSSALEIHMGVFRIVCSNGLIVAGEDYGKAKFYHRGADTDMILEALSALIGKFDMARESMRDFRDTPIRPEHAVEFARQALQVYNGGLPAPRAIDPLAIIQPKRYEDDTGNLWGLFNVAQENLLNGRVLIRKADKDHPRSSYTRPVREISAATRLNQGLWNLARNWFESNGLPPETTSLEGAVEAVDVL